MFGINSNLFSKFKNILIIILTTLVIWCIILGENENPYLLDLTVSIFVIILVIDVLQGRYNNRRETEKVETER